jgi:hypothetical protein
MMSAPKHKKNRRDFSKSCPNLQDSDHKYKNIRLTHWTPSNYLPKCIKFGSNINLISTWKWNPALQKTSVCFPDQHSQNIGIHESNAIRTCLNLHQWSHSRNHCELSYSLCACTIQLQNMDKTQSKWSQYHCPSTGKTIQYSNTSPCGTQSWSQLATQRRSSTRACKV